MPPFGAGQPWSGSRRLLAAQGHERPEPRLRLFRQFGQDERDDLRAQANDSLVRRVHGDFRRGGQEPRTRPPLADELMERGSQPLGWGNERGVHGWVLIIPSSMIISLAIDNLSCSNPTRQSRITSAAFPPAPPGPTDGRIQKPDAFNLWPGASGRRTPRA